MARRGFVAVRKWTCPNHPDGPPRLPAEGYECEELTIGEAYEPEEIAALREVVAIARGGNVLPSADTVEAMFGLCCIGHRWKIAGFRRTSRSEETVASFAALLRDFAPPAMPGSVLLAELERYSVEVEPGHPLPIRIPLVRDVGEDTTDGD